MHKKDIILSFIAGLGSAVFLLLVFPNVQALAFIENYKIAFAIAVPILFVAGFWIADLLSQVPRLSILRQIGKYGIVGVLNTAVDFGILNLLITYTNLTQGLPLIIFNVVAFIAAVTNSFFWNRLWVFEDPEHAGGAKKFAEFFVASVLSIILNTAIVYGMTTYVPPLFGLDEKTWINVAKVVATAFSMVWNFLAYKFVVFRSNTAS